MSGTSYVTVSIYLYSVGIVTLILTADYSGNPHGLFVKLRGKMTHAQHTDPGYLFNDILMQTVKYFGGEAHEAERYREAIRKYQALEFKVMGGENVP
jgi:ABC-type transport system involved in Fe-S cluster assembly fused permease/ATPase subunit